VLRLSSTAAGLSTLSGLAAGSDTNSIAGITYDTLTHKTGPQASGSVVRASGQRIADGTLTIQGFQLPLNELSVVQEREDCTKYEHAYDGHIDSNGSPLKLNVVDHRDHVAGYLTRPHHDYGKLGFLLIDPDQVTDRNLEGTLTTKERWRSADQSFEIPTTGVPTDSSISRLHEILGRERGDIR
jgi:hypothetical protein